MGYIKNISRYPQGVYKKGGKLWLNVQTQNANALTAPAEKTAPARAINATVRPSAISPKKKKNNFLYQRRFLCRLFDVIIFLWIIKMN